MQQTSPLKPFALSPVGLMQFIGLTLLGTALMTLAAKTQIPFWPVPMTLHTLAVMVFAAALGPRLAAAIFISYLTLGAFGVPVFSGTPERGIGLAYMAGPTGGYLLGYMIATLFVGIFAHKRGLATTFFVMLLGMIPVYGLGLIWLAQFVPNEKVLALGFMPFILGDVVKIALAALLVWTGGKALENWLNKNQQDL